MATMSLANGTAGKDLRNRPFTILGAHTWADALRIVRTRRGFSFADVANAVCRDRPHLPKQWEMGQGYPSKHDLRRLYNALPQLKEAADLLPADLRVPLPPPGAPPPVPPPEVHETVAMAAAPAPTIVAADKPPVMAPPPPPPAAPSPPQWKTFGEALGALINKEGMDIEEFAKTAGLTKGTIYAYIRGTRVGREGRRVNLGITLVVYERLLALLPDLRNAPRPRVSSRIYKQVPGKPGANAMATPKGVIARPPDPAIAVPERRPLPPMPETIRKPAPILPPPAVRQAATAIEAAGAAWGLAIARVHTLKAELARAEAEVTRAHDNMQAAIKAMEGGGQ